MSELHLAAAQAVSIRGDVAANLEHHGELAELAAEHGVRWVIYPELSLTGYELDLAAEFAFSAEDPRIEPLRMLADSRQIGLVVGAPIRLASGLHIGAFVIEPGRGLRIYTKRHVHSSEQHVFVSGTRNPSLALGDATGALAICADTSHPEHVRAAARSGAAAYLAGVFFSPAGMARESETLARYAAEHGLCVLMANSGGDATGFETAGGSAIWSETGQRVVQLRGTGPGLAIAHRTPSESGSSMSWKGATARLTV